MFGCKLLPIHIVVIVYNTAPFWSSIIGYFVNNELINKYQALGILGCFIGLLILILSKDKNKSEAEKAEMSNYQKTLGISVVLLCSIFFSVCGVFTRKLREVHFSVIQFYYGLSSFILYFTYLLIEH